MCLNLGCCSVEHLINVLQQYLPSPQPWPSSPVCFNKAASTNLDTVSKRDSLLREALSQSAAQYTQESGTLVQQHCWQEGKQNVVCADLC